MKNINIETLDEINVILGRINDLQNQLAARLNCNPSDIKKETAKIMEAEGLKTHVTKRAGRTYTIQLKQGSSDGLTLDTTKAKALIESFGAEVPMKIRKGASATVLVK